MSAPKPNPPRWLRDLMPSAGPCPRCGQIEHLDLVFWAMRNGWQVMCHRCLRWSVPGISAAAAVENWNLREQDELFPGLEDGSH